MFSFLFGVQLKICCWDFVTNIFIYFSLIFYISHGNEELFGCLLISVLILWILIVNESHVILLHLFIFIFIFLFVWILLLRGELLRVAFFKINLLDLCC